MIRSRSLRATAHSPVRVLGRTFTVAQLAVVSASAVGLALAAPSIWWPTSRLTISDPERGSMLSDQSSWSWGQVVVRTGDSFERAFPNTPGLALFVVSLVVGLLAVLGWALGPRRVGALVGVLGLTVATVRVLTAVTERLGSTQVDAYANTGLDVRSYLQPAAVMETIAGGLLLLALGGMVALAVSAPAPATATEPSGIPAVHDGTTLGTGHSSLTGPATDFSEPAPNLQERPDRRFEPPA